jgi:tetratricopeptide (TPR) repeat protein
MAYLDSKFFDSALHWLKVGRYDQALTLFLTALSKYEEMKQTSEVASKICRCRYFAAQAVDRLGREIEAETLLKSAVQITPEVLDTTIKAAAYFAYGEFLVEHNRNAEAIPQLQAALELNDYPSNGWRLLGIAFDETAQHNEALRCFKRALENNPFDPQILYNLAVCLRYLKRFDESCETFDQAIDLGLTDSFKAQAYNARGGMLESAGKDEKAEESYRMTMKLDPTHDGAPFNLADLLERQGHMVEALHYWQKAVELDPSDLRAARRLARLRAKLGEK